MKIFRSVLLLILFSFVLLQAGAVGNKKKKKPATHPYAAYKTPIYFQDYYSFYDPKRGFVYFSDSMWHVTDTVPTFMKDATVGKARIQVLQDPNERMPEDHFDQYLKMYPANTLIAPPTVPIITLSKQKK